MSRTMRWVLAFLMMSSLLAASPGAIANWLWCCDHSQHAGIDSQARCDSNTIQFPDKKECQAHKQRHDKNTGHSSKCVSR
ncbi:MAG: hypothetical protein QNK18_07735 [Gammaproteobacteria bacterium]|nr:hypothetical protein [Gammaproteobacteria bacterium]MDJ0891070.1 hypothetical protein [Gammaproteobacteria bacterium]